jgi:predicted DNA-binding protein with PD1-like motif
MRYSQAKQGRVFVIRLEDGEIIHTQLEKFAAEHGIKAASVTIVGGVDQDSCLIVGPEKGRGISPVIPMSTTLKDVHEATGTGTIFPDDTGKPVLHLHMACGRNEKTITGCIRSGVKVWHVLEVILFELTECAAVRRLDPVTGFKLLAP